MPFIKRQRPWNKIDNDSSCMFCGRVFHIAPSRLRDRKIKRGSYCSKFCANKGRIGQPAWNKGISQQAGSGAFRETTKKFLGTYKEYQLLHYWVRKMLGKPTLCSSCGGKENLTWANKSQQYGKDINDWFVLCRKCHFIYDQVDLRRRKYA